MYCTYLEFNNNNNNIFGSLASAAWIVICTRSLPLSNVKSVLLLSHSCTGTCVCVYIIRKNKSFRPRERPKKGLKNLQTVKTLTAGQNLSNQMSGAVKTRKQPLTVTAQFQSSLSALMDTLNQVIQSNVITLSLDRFLWLLCVQLTGESVLYTMHQVEPAQDTEQIRRAHRNAPGE